jgi:starch synthase
MTKKRAGNSVPPRGSRKSAGKNNPSRSASQTGELAGETPVTAVANDAAGDVAPAEAAADNQTAAAGEPVAAPRKRARTQTPAPAAKVTRKKASDASVAAAAPAGDDAASVKTPRKRAPRKVAATPDVESSAPVSVDAVAEKPAETKLGPPRLVRTPPAPKVAAKKKSDEPEPSISRRDVERVVARKNTVTKSAIKWPGEIDGVPVTPKVPAVPDLPPPVEVPIDPAPPQGDALAAHPPRAAAAAEQVAVAASAPVATPVSPEPVSVAKAVPPVAAAVEAAAPALVPASAPKAAAPAIVSSRGADDGLSILMVASEAVPFAKTGGLADVVAALPAALARIGHRVTTVLPRYRGVEVSGPPRLTLDVQLGRERHAVKIHEVEDRGGARVWLVDEPALFDRQGIYGTNGHDHPDNPRRFALLARAALDAAVKGGLAPDIVHAHDWQGGLAPVYLKTRYASDPVLGGVPSVFTIHNIAYAGICEPGWLEPLDLGLELYRTDGGLEFFHKVSLLKAGINFSEKITTVSPGYARELLTPEFAFGFEGVLAARRADLVGILNGIDTDSWNPATDPYIPATYTAADLSGKREAKRALLQAYGLPHDEAALRVPVIGMVSRMVDQKGLDLIAQASSELPHLGARFVVLGTGEPRYEEMWRALASYYPDRIAANVGFDEPLSHLVEAGADLFLMPSRFEPCGLNQMYSLRYGTLPFVRATGGLDDTVDNYHPATGGGNGFKFWEPSGPALVNTLRWALSVYYQEPDTWRRLQRAAMAADFSWTRSAQQYADLYAQVLRTAGRAARHGKGAAKVAGIV